MNVELNSYGGKFIRYLIENHGPVTKEELCDMSNMRMIDVIPYLTILCDRDIVCETENGYVICEN